MGKVTSNVSRLVSEGAARVPGTLSARLLELIDYRGSNDRIPDDDAFWARCEGASEISSITWREVPLGNPCASYHEGTLTLACGLTATARVIRPLLGDLADECVPVVVMFGDAPRPARGWHHMTRFVSLGMGVITLDAPFDALALSAKGDGELAGALESQAIMAQAMRRVVEELSWADTRRVHVWGEGFGGGLALIAASVSGLPVASLAVANPMPLDCDRALVEAREGGLIAAVRATGERSWAVLRHLDGVRLAQNIACPAFVGTGLMDTDAPVSGQFALVNRLAGDVWHQVYPKHGHERINDLENDHLRFLHRTL